jgi:bifunctional DNase/RNase
MKKKQVKILGLSYSQSQSGSYVVVLSEKKGNRKIPVIIKPADAQQIAVKLEGIKSMRPLTHDLFKSMTDIFSITFKGIHIYSLLEGIFYSKIIMTNGVEDYDVECTIGDGLALSLVYKCPIWVNDDIIDSAGIIINDDGTQPEVDEDETNVSITVEDLEHMMQNAIANEDYEIAAELRDRIAKLKES